MSELNDLEKRQLEMRATEDDVEFAVNNDMAIWKVVEDREMEASKVQSEFMSKSRTNVPISNLRKGRRSRKQRDRWFFKRFDTLRNEGFTPEESNLMANSRISTRGVRHLRNTRIKLYNAVYDRLRKKYNGPVQHNEVLDVVRANIVNTQYEVFDWDAYRRLVYR